jgi:hypothetical protein
MASKSNKRTVGPPHPTQAPAPTQPAVRPHLAIGGTTTNRGEPELAGPTVVVIGATYDVDGGQQFV